MTDTYFAKAKDHHGNIHYFVSNTEESIERHCEGTLLGYEMAIEEWCSNVTPAMVQKHFKWLGKGRNPFVVAKPFEYGIPVKDHKYNIPKW